MQMDLPENIDQFLKERIEELEKLTKSELNPEKLKDYKFRLDRLKSITIRVEGL